MAIVGNPLTRIKLTDPEIFDHCDTVIGAVTVHRRDFCGTAPRISEKWLIFYASPTLFHESRRSQHPFLVSSLESLQNLLPEVSGPGGCGVAHPSFRFLMGAVVSVPFNNQLTRDN